MTRMARFLAIVLMAGAAIPAFAAAAVQPTRIVVRVVAHDGKILGTDAGGAEVWVYEAATHRLLAHGTQNGDSGDPKQIMGTPHLRSDAKVFASPTAQAFVANLQLRRPTRIEVVAEGPLAFPASRQRVSKTLWILPGQSMDAANQDGIVLELYGFAMKFNEVTPGARTLSVSAHVAMMCGCPIQKDGYWPESQFTVTASLLRNGAPVAEKRMTWTAKDTFAITFEGVAPATYELAVNASDLDRANFSAISRTVTIPK